MTNNAYIFTKPPKEPYWIEEFFKGQETSNNVARLAHSLDAKYFDRNWDITDDIELARLLKVMKDDCKRLSDHSRNATNAGGLPLSSRLRSLITIFLETSGDPWAIAEAILAERSSLL